MQKHQSNLAIDYVSTETLSPNPRNARTHSKQQIRQIAASIKEFGFLNPILADQTGRIIAGHGRWEAAKLEDMASVPVVRAEHLTPDQIRAYVIADNKLAALAGWDKSILAVELQHLINLDNDLDVTITGFEISEIDLIIGDAAGKPDEADDIEAPQTGPAICQNGDLWQLGRHRVLCADALDPASFVRLTGNKKAALVFTDPPYNVRVDGHVSGKGRARHREFAMATGEMSAEEFLAFLKGSCSQLAQNTARGSVLYLCMDWRHIEPLLAAGRESGFELLNLCVWTKHNGGMGSLYRSQHELIAVFRNGETRHRNNVQLGKYGRNRTNVWDYPGANNFGRMGEEGGLLSQHPTVKPVQLVADALLDCSTRGDLVLDPFLGSGSTLIAAERTGRVCHGIEIDPLYVDLIIRRWQRHAGDHAVHIATGKRFDEIEMEAHRD